MIKLLAIFFLFLSFVVKSQDQIITKETQYDPDPDLKITKAMTDTIYFLSRGVNSKIPTNDVVAIKKNYLERGTTYFYIKPSYERIYGIKNGNVFFKADYRFSSSNIELSKECFLENYRVYDTIIYENKEEDVFIRNKETNKRKRVHKNVKICVYLKDDILNRKFKGVVYSTSKDTSRLVMKIGVNGEKHIYMFKNEDIKSICMEAPLVFVARHTLALVSLSSGIFYWTAAFYYKSKWYNTYDFNKWYLSK